MSNDVSRIYFQDPADNAWHELAWEHAQEVAVPFSAEALAYARRLVLAEGRHVDERRALAAQALGLWPSALYDQLGRTERACGGPLVNRSPRPPGTGIPTPLGDQLCQQARDYLSLPASPGNRR